MLGQFLGLLNSEEFRYQVKVKESKQKQRDQSAQWEIATEASAGSPHSKGWEGISEVQECSAPQRLWEMTKKGEKGFQEVFLGGTSLGGMWWLPYKIFHEMQVKTIVPF